jgi:elongation factor P
MITANELRPGKACEYEGQLWIITSFEHIKPGKGSPFVRVKMRSLKQKSTMEKTFRPDEKIKDAYLQTKKMQYLYKDNGYVFMDQETFEQYTLSEEDCKEEADFLLENSSIDMLFYEDNPIGLHLPASIELKVSQTDPGLRGDTAQGGSKPATLETGLVVQVPLFIDEGNIVKVDTRTKEYLERVSIQ